MFMRGDGHVSKDLKKKQPKVIVFSIPSGLKRPTLASHFFAFFSDGTYYNVRETVFL